MQCVSENCLDTKSFPLAIIYLSSISDLTIIPTCGESQSPPTLLRACLMNNTLVKCPIFSGVCNIVFRFHSWDGATTPRSRYRDVHFFHPGHIFPYFCFLILSTPILFLQTWICLFGLWSFTVIEIGECRHVVVTHFESQTCGRRLGHMIDRRGRPPTGFCFCPPRFPVPTPPPKPEMPRFIARRGWLINHSHGPLVWTIVKISKHLANVCDFT
jgi:hypothetical protein